jgi:hypothetical protein
MNVRDSWVFLRAGQTLGKRLPLTVSSAVDDKEGPASSACKLNLRPGKYYAQAIYNHWLTAWWPNNPAAVDAAHEQAGGDDPRPLPPFTVADMHKPLVVSDPVSFIVAADGGSREVERESFRLQLDMRPVSGRDLRPNVAPIRVTMSNSGSHPVELYNPFLSRLHWDRRAVALNVISEDGAISYDVLTEESGSSKRPNYFSWVTVPPGGFISTEFDVYLGRKLAAPGSRAFPPGQYMLELVGHDALTSGRPVFDRKDDSDQLEHSGGRVRFRQWQIDFPGRAVFRSNRVNLTLPLE